MAQKLKITSRHPMRFAQQTFEVFESACGVRQWRITSDTASGEPHMITNGFLDTDEEIDGLIADVDAIAGFLKGLRDARAAS